MQFLAKAFNHSKKISNSFAVYVPKNVIDFHGIDPEEYAMQWYSKGSIHYRDSPHSEWVKVSGDVGPFSSRNTLRVVMQSWETDLAGKVLEIKVELEQD